MTMEFVWSLVEGAYEEVTALSSLAIPSVLSNMLESGMGVVDVMMLGYLGKGHLAALSVGNAFFNIPWYFIEGFLTAQDTLASNAHGTGDVASVRQWTYISFFTSLVLCAAASTSFLFVQEILGTVFWMPFHLKTKAAVHIYLLSPGLWFLTMSRVLQKYFQSQNDMLPGLVAGLVGNGVNIALNYTFIYTCEFGFAGCGLATTLARLCSLLYLAWCINRSGQWPTILSELRGLGRDPAVSRTVLRLGHFLRKIGCCNALRLGHAYEALGVRRGDGEGEEEEDYNDPDSDDNKAAADEGGIELMTPGQRKAVAQGGKRAAGGGTGKGRSSIKAKTEAKRAATSVKSPLATPSGGGKTSLVAGHDSESDSGSDSDSSSEGATNNLDHDQGVEDSLPTTASAATARRRRLVLVRVLRFVLLGLPGGIMMGLDSWVFVVMSFFVAQMGTVPLATHEVMAMFSNFVFLSLPFAIAVATTVRVSHLLAAQRPAQARFSSHLAMAFSAVVVAACGALVYYTPQTLGSAFTDDDDILYRLRRVAPILAGFQVVYGLQGVAQGSLRAMGRQQVIAGFTLFCVWGLGLPSGLYMGFYARPTLGFDGLWGGVLLGMGSLAIILLLLVLVTNWEREARRALLRADLPSTAAAAAAAAAAASFGSGDSSALALALRSRGRAKNGQGEIGLARPGSLARGGFPMHMLSLGEELDEIELLDEGIA